MESNYKLIARNTVFLYFRQMVVMFVGLYTSRVILNAVGVADYGIYNVVGGFVAMFNIISGAFSVAITRFMASVRSYGDTEEMRKCYSVALVIQIFQGGFICLLLATVGVWYVVNIMVLPDGRTGAALWVLLFSAISFFVSLISIPYNAMIVAHEHMRAFAYIGIAEAVLKLAVALMVRFSPWDKLIVYSFLTVVSALLVRLLYALYCHKHFEECHFSRHFDRKLLREMLTFVSWAFLGNGSDVVKNQGVSMVMNLFGGTTVNAARGIAININNAVRSFTSNYIQAIQPQITQLYTLDNRESMRDLICRSCRYAFYMMLILCLPLVKNIRYVLQLWLGQVPDYVVVFSILTLFESLVQSINNPLLYGVLATGKIKVYEIALSVNYIATLPLSYVALQVGFPMTSVYYIALLSAVILLVTLLWQSANTYGFSYRVFASKVLLRIGIVTILSATVTGLANIPIQYPFVNLIVESCVSVATTAVIILLFGIEKEERKVLFTFIRNKVCRLK